MIALIPARSGSKRIPNKNIKDFCGKPLIAYTINAAIASNVFDRIIVSTDSDEIGAIAEKYGAEWIKRPAKISGELSPDAEWIEHIFGQIKPCDFMILRPTSPFRTDETIKRAIDEWSYEKCMKAIEKIKQHPSKSWILFGSSMSSFVENFEHLKPYQWLPEMYIQNGCLEIRLEKSLFGVQKYYQPFFTVGYEGFDLNTPDDWLFAEMLVEKGLVTL